MQLTATKKAKARLHPQKNEGKNEGNYSFRLDIATIYQHPSRICQQAKTTTYSVFEPKKYRLINRLIRIMCLCTIYLIQCDHLLKFIKVTFIYIK